MVSCLTFPPFSFGRKDCWLMAVLLVMILWQHNSGCITVPGCRRRKHSLAFGNIYKLINCLVPYHLLIIRTIERDTVLKTWLNAIASWKELSGVLVSCNFIIRWSEATM